MSEVEPENGAFFSFIYQYVDEADFKKYFRLVVFTGAYILLRGLYQNWAQKYHLQKQIDRDNEEKAKEPIRAAAAQKKHEEEIIEEAKTFGWGKKTRKETKLKEKYIETQFNELRERHQSAYDAAEDHDIEDLLED